MKYVNLHNHTVYSDGKNTVRENVEQALRLGMGAIGFSDHSHTAIDERYCMMPDAYAAYEREIRSIAAEYEEKIPVLLGIELDYYSEPLPIRLDYTIASVHYIVKDTAVHAIDSTPEKQLRCFEESFRGDRIAAAEAYYQNLTTHVRRTNPTFVGHFDVITKFSLIPEDDKRYRDLARDALSDVVKHCPYVEINTGAISRGWRTTPYPQQYLLSHLLEIGGRPVLGADSHKIEHLTYAFDEAVELLRACGFSSIFAFGKNGYEEVKI